MTLNYRGPLPKRAIGRVNAWLTALRSSARWGPMLRRHLTIVTYTGRRSGRTFSTLIGYRRQGDIVTITVRMPDAKTWWRNFTGAGGPLSLDLDGAARTGHAVARREKGHVIITVRLDRR
ncbi:hypothetical protein ACQPZF_05865 [Actinosynnema sp. CS-041913]|uniref:hypothetical protein n=1 Tax=Actinosynnema sp. CS-041913 TaxID=3239917 RepID=UPI003D8A3EF3